MDNCDDPVTGLLRATFVKLQKKYFFFTIYIYMCMYTYKYINIYDCFPNYKQILTTEFIEESVAG